MSSAPSPASADADPGPAVTVLLAVHDGEAYVESALRSVMDQTLRDIEILVVDDASSDSTPEILARLAAEDDRIRVLTARTNLGLPAALNHGLAQARGVYVARMDADDLCLPDRLETQKRYMDQHPEIVLCGGSVTAIDAAGRPGRTSIRPRDAFATRWLNRFHMPLIHPTFMFRRDAVGPDRLRYDPDLRVSQDYGFCTLAYQYGEVACLPEPLLLYRSHPGAASSTKWAEQTRNAKIIAEGFQKRELSPAVFDGLARFRAVFYDLKTVTPGDMGAIGSGMRRMIAEDRAAHPDRRSWMMRQGAQLIFTAIIRGKGRKKPAVLGAFALLAPDFALALVMRLLETRRLLPAALRSDPKVWRQGATTAARPDPSAQRRPRVRAAPRGAGPNGKSPGRGE